MTPGTKVSLGRDFCSFVCLRRAVLDRRTRAASGVCIILIAVAAVLRAGSLAIVSPAGASAGIPIYITGTGFNTVAANNQVTFKATTGVSVVAAGVSIATVDPTSGLRRLQVVLPDGLPSGTASVSVKNLATGEISAGKSLEILALQLSVLQAPAGTSNVLVRVTGSPNAKFVSGGTRVTFGSDVAVSSVAIESSTSLTAVLSIPAAAAPGVRDVSVITSAQNALLRAGFAVTPLNHPPAASAGGPYSGVTAVPISFDGSLSSDPDRDPLTFSWTFGDGSQPAATAQANHAYANAGTYTATLTVKDNWGGTTTATATVSVSAPPPPNHNPSITSNAVTAATEGQPYAYDVNATDPDANDVLTYALTQFPPGMTINSTTGVIAWTAVAAGQTPVIVQVSDGRGGSADQSFAIVVAAANHSPTITSSPLTSAAEGRTYANDVDATDPDAGDTLTYSLTQAPSGMSIDASTGLIAWTPLAIHVPSVSVTVRVADGNGGSATQSFTVSVASNHSPAITSIPITAATEGQPYRYDVDAVDQDADGVQYALTQAPSGMTIDPTTGVIGWASPAGAQPSVHVAIAVSDGRGATVTQTFDITVTPAALGRGVIAGRVLDDVSGLPLANTHVRLASVDGAPNDTPAVDTDALGRFRLSSAVGRARVDARHDGYTAGVRFVQVVDGQRVDPLDVRLTAFDSRLNVIQAAAGGTALSSGGGARIVVPAGAISGDASIRVTEISPQALIAPLPLGWSPLAMIDIAPAALTFSPGSIARISSTAATGVTTVVVFWDDDQGAWVSGGSGAGTNREIETPVAHGGQIVLAVADAPPQAPPLAAAGQPLIGVAPRAPPDAQVTLSPAPRILFAQATARSRVTATVVPTSPLPSGTTMSVESVETFSLSDGGVLRLPPQPRQFSLYQTGAASLRSVFPVAPSRAFAPFQLRQGVVDLAARLPGAPFGPHGRVVTAAGAEVVGPADERLTIPAGAASGDVPVDLLGMASADFTTPVPGGFSLVSAVTVDLHGASFAQPTSLSIVNPSASVQGHSLLLAQVVEIGSSSRLLLVAAARVVGSRIVSDVDPFGDGSLILPGVTTEGRYAFLSAPDPIGYLAGSISGTDGAALANALVLPQSGIGAATNALGRYVIAGPVGATTLTVTNVATGDVEHATGVFSTGGGPATTIGIGAAAPAISSIDPANGAAGVPLAASIIVTFSRAIDPASVSSAGARLESAVGAVQGTFSLAPGGLSGTFRPAALLASATSYQFSVGSGLRDTTGRPLATPLTIAFATIDLTPPPPPAAGTVIATIPDATGNSTISGTQGSAEPGGLVIVRNVRTGALTTLTPRADGSFAGTVGALRSDRLELILKDAAGNATTAPIAPFKNADGSVVVGAAGGHLDGGGGVTVDVPPGALPDGTVVKVVAVSADQLPVPAPAGYAFQGGLRIDLGGVALLSELKVSVPAPPQATADDQILVARAVPFLDSLAWTVEERARFANDRYTTASPPFVGVVSEGTYAFLQPPGACTSYVSLRYHIVRPTFLIVAGLPFVVPTTDYERTTIPARCGSELPLTVLDPDTHAALQQASFFAPAARDDIAFPIEVLTDDTTPVTILSINNPTDQAVTKLEVQFSKALDRASVANFIVKDSSGAEVPGSFEFLDHTSRIVFQPLSPFRQGEQYTLILAGVKDQAGHAVDSQPLTFTPYGPRSISALRQTPELRAALEKCGPGGCTTSALDVAVIGRTLFVANGVRTADDRYSDSADPKRLLAIDVTDPFHPSLIGWAATATNPRALATVQGASLSIGAGTFSGDLLFVAGGGRVAGGELNSKLEIWDATACDRRPVLPNTNCLDGALKGFRLLSTPAQVAALPGVPPDSGVPLQIAVMHQPAVGGDVLLAYVLVVPIGIELVNVAQAFNASAPNQSALGPDGVSPGDFTDLSVLKNRVVTVGVNPISHQPRVDILTAQLGLVTELPPPVPGGLNGFAGAARLATLENAPFDVDNDGRIGLEEENDGDEVKGSDELFDLALVASGPLTDGCTAVTPCGELYVLDLSAHTDLAHGGGARVLDRIPLDGAPFSIAIDPTERLAYVELRGRGIATVDLGFLLKVLRGDPSGNGLIDANHDGQDDRVVSIFSTGGHQQDLVVGRIKIDANRGLAFVNGATTGVEIVQVANKSNELALDFNQVVAPRNKDLKKEKQVLLGLIQQAVAVLRDGMPPTATREAIPPLPPGTEISVLEQGSGSCFWRGSFPKRPESTCPAFQPGTSDHDFEVFVNQPHVAEAQRLLNAFIDSKPAGLEQLGDLSLFAMPLEPMRDAELLNGTPLYGAGVSDATGDLGMGRQSLLLLWLLEGEYVDGQQGTLPDLRDILALLKQKPDGAGDPQCAGPAPPSRCPVIAGEPSGIPRLEGYEWSLLQEFNFYKTGAMLRVRGACGETDAPRPLNAALSASGLENDPVKNFNERDVLAGDCHEEIHSVAKAAIRTVLARIVADTSANPLVLDIDPAHQDDLGAYRRNACFEGPFTTANAPYEQVPCTGFEHYVASVAVRVARRGLVFTDADLPQIYEFYCTKVDKCPAPGINTDADADRFVRGALKFIQDSQQPTSTVKAYTDTVRLDTKPIGAVPLLFEGPSGDPQGGIASICEALFAAHGSLIAPFVHSDDPPLTPITAASPRKVLRLCNYLIVWLKTNGDTTEPVPAGMDQAYVQFEGADHLYQLKHRLGAKHYVDWKLQVRALNFGARPVSVNLSLYEGNGTDRDDYKTPFPQLPGVTSGKTIPVALDAGEIQVIAKEPVPDQPDPDKKQPIFPLVFNLTRPELAPNRPRALTFFLDPERTVPEADKKDNQAGFFYYVLDTSSNTAPPSTPDKPVAPIDNVDPDPLAVPRPRLAFDFTVRGRTRGGFVGGKVISVGLDEDVTLKYEIRNLGPVKVKDVEIFVRRDLRGQGPEVSVMTIPELAPAGEPNDHILLSDPAVFTPTDEKTYQLAAHVEGVDSKGNKIGPVYDFVSITATDDLSLAKVRLYDASALADLAHPFSRFLANTDTAGHDVPLVGAVTDGDEQGGGARVRVEVEGLTPGIPATITLKDPDFPDATDGLGWLESGDQLALQTVTVTPDIFQRAVVYYRPPAVFVRDAHRADDIAKLDRAVKLSIVQPGVGGGAKRILLRRPPVFLVHGLFSTTKTWDELQPLVPEGGLPVAYAPTKGFDGRFDVFAVGNPNVSGTVVEEAAAVKQQIKMSLAMSLPGYAIGRVDVIGHSMGSLVIRQIIDDFITSEAPWGGVTKMPFRKLIAMDSPFSGTPLASKIVEIRGQPPVKADFTAKDLLDVTTKVSDGDTPQMTPELKIKVKLEQCAFMVQSIGLTPKFFIRGAIDDLVVNSPAIQRIASGGIVVPSHHISGVTIPPELGISLTMEALWGSLGYFCHLTPDENTGPATELFNVGVRAAVELLVPLKVRELGSLPGVGKSIKWAPVAENARSFLARVGPTAKFARKEESGDPIPVFAHENDRADEADGQLGGIPVTDRATSSIVGTMDHNSILKTPGVTVSACGDLASTTPPTGLHDLNGDGTPDITCRLIFLLEAAPASPYFYRTIHP